MIFEKIFRWLGISGNEKYRHKRKFRKRGRISKCNILRFWEGVYSSDSGASDYRTFCVIKNGKVNKRILKRYKKGEQDYLFNLVELRPITPVAFIKIIKKDEPVTNEFTRYTTSYRVLLIRGYNRVPRLLNIPR